MNYSINTLDAKLYPMCHLLALLGAHHILHVSRIRVKQEYNHIYIDKKYNLKNMKACDNNKTHIGSNFM